MNSHRRSSRRNQLAVSHSKNWLIGRTAVLEALRAARWPVRKLFVDESITTSDEAVRCAVDQNVDFEFVSHDRLSELCQARHHQGLAARMGDFPYRSEDWLLQNGSLDAANLIVICDRIQDSHNFGAILRSCDALNAFAVVIGEREQSPVSPQVARSSAGAVNHLDIVATDSLPQTTDKLSEAGFTIVAASEKATQTSWDCNLGGRIALILGNEAEGVTDSLMELCQLKTKVPMLGQVDSLNVAVAAGMLLHEIRRQQMTADS